MRFLSLIKPVMCLLPEVAAPDRKVREKKVGDLARGAGFLLQKKEGTSVANSVSVLVC